MCARWPTQLSVLHGQSQEDEAARKARPVAREPDHEDPAKFIDFAYAPDAATAERQVAEEYEIGETLRHKLAAVREEF